MSIGGRFDPALVALSIFIATLASYTALDLAGRVRASTGRARQGWLAAAAVAMGCGIWSMHFVAMLAFIMPMPVRYNGGLTFASFLVAVGVTAVAFFFVSRPRTGMPQIAVAGLFLGAGICAMHYIGMAAMRMAAAIEYDGWLVALSFVIAAGASTAGLALAMRHASLGERIASALVMGVAVSGMHYTGMAAARFVMTHDGVGSGLSSLAQASLALAVAATTFLILSLALASAVVDRRRAALEAREAERLRESELRFRTIYNRTPIPMQSLDEECCLVDVSDYWSEMLGYRHDDVVGRPLADFLTETSRMRLRETWPELLERNEIREAEFQYMKRSGEVIDVLLSARIEHEADGRFSRALAVLVDVTERKRLEAQLAQAQKMEAVGQLTGGIAHDFNNVLTAALGNLDLIEMRLRDRPEIQRLAATASRALARAAKLTQQLLAFSRRQRLRSEAVDLNQLIVGMDELLQRTAEANVEIRKALAPDLKLAAADANQLQTALLNLVLNARDAMARGGKLTIATANARIARATPTADGEMAPGDYVSLVVSDTGHGMSSEVLARAFEPFFTTKDVGKGSGLGLSMVYGFARQSGGHIELESRPDEGTTVTLYLPQGAAQAAAEPEPLRRAEAQSRSTVLVVEDDPDVREFAAHALRARGYSVLEAENAEAGLKTLDEVATIDVLFTDVVMPGMNGIELARAAVSRRPDLKIVVTSGYAARNLEQPPIPEPIHFLRKPYRADELGAAIRDVFARAS